MTTRRSPRRGQLPKRPKKQRTSRSRRGPTFFVFVALVLASIAAGVTYVRVDARVARSLKTFDFRRESAVYSDPFMVFDGVKMSESLVRRQLTARQYREVATSPQSPGEYRIVDTTLEVINHEFLLPNQTTRTPRRTSYNFTTGSVSDDTRSGRTDLVLEPIMVAPLGSGDARVSTIMRVKDLPSYLPLAFLAIEDNRFYSHFGIDPIGIGRAMIKNIMALRVIEGGSTITQQLAKNLFFSAKKSFDRKIQEAFAALSLERRLSKEQILELYMNEVYFGRDGAVSVHGVGEASTSFFGKPATEISLSQAALLAGLVKAPSAFNPRRHLARALERRDVVLIAMRDAGMITEAQFNTARSEKITIERDSPHRRVAPYFLAAVQQDLERRIDVEAAIASGLSVFTGLDKDMQECAEQAIAEGVTRLEKSYPSLRRKKSPLQAALVALEPYSGLVKAWVGGREYGTNQFNHVSQAERQIGSTMKPFVYLTALDASLNDYRPATTVSILTDEPMKVPLETRQVWMPENYDREFRGDVTLRYALEHSLNIPAAYIGQRVGLHNVVRTGERFRIADSLPAFPSLSLGAADTTLLRLAGAYATLANGGIYVKPRLFTSAVAGEGELSIADEYKEERVADERAVFVLTNILQGVLERGTAKGVRAAGYMRPAAGKTGTSNDTRDAWFLGYTPNLVAGVWLGFDDNSKVGLTGGAAAVPIWTTFMKCAAPFHEDIPFLAPSGIVMKEVDLVTHKLATESCPREGVVREVFVAGTEPQEACMSHGAGEDTMPVAEFDPPAPAQEEYGADREGSHGSLAEDFEMEARKRREGNEESFWGSLWGR